jgi:hypothetical protein
MNQTSNSIIENDEISFFEIVKSFKSIVNYIFSKWKILFFTTLISMSLGYFYAKSIPIEYKASLVFAIDGDKGSSVGAIGLASQFGLDLGQNGTGTFEGSNLIELMRSRSIIEKTLLDSISTSVLNKTLAQYYLDLNNIKVFDINKNIITFKCNEDRSNYSVTKDSLLEQLYIKILSNHLVIKQMKKVSFINIEVISNDEKFSKVFCEQIALQVSRFYSDTKSKKARINVEILQKQADSIRSELNYAISGVASANDNVFNLNPSVNVKRTTAAKRQIDVQFNTAILTQLISNLELAKVNLRKETPLIQIIDKPIFPLEKIKVSKSKTMMTFAIVTLLINIIVLLIFKKTKN